jgi:hypothetical protein
MRALAAEPEERFESCGALVRAFEAALEPGLRVEDDADLILPETVFDGPPLVAAAPPLSPPPPPPVEPPERVEPTPQPFDWVETPSTPFEWVETPPAAPEVAPAREGPAAPPAAPAPSAEPPAPPVDAGPVVAPPGRERRRHVATAVIVVLTLLAGVGGYFASNANRGDDSGSSTGAQARADAAPVTRSLRSIAARDLPDFRCTVTPGPAGGTVAETAACTPKKAGTPPIRRVTLTRLSTKRALDQLYADTRAFTEDPAARRPGDCRPNRPWHGSGRWFAGGAGTAAAGRMFCATVGGRAAAQPRIVWTVNAPLVMAEAFAPRSADLGAWWQRTRNLGG